MNMENHNWKVLRTAALIAMGLMLVAVCASVFYGRRAAPAHAPQPVPPAQDPGLDLRGGKLKEAIAPEAVPVEVREVLKQFVPEFTIAGAERETDLKDNDRDYRLKLVVGTAQFEAQVDVDGKTGKMDGEISATIAPEDVPKAVAEAFQKNAPHLAMTAAEKRLEFDEDGVKVTYRWKYQEPQCRVTISEDGQKVQVREKKASSAIPPAVLEKAQQALPGAQLRSEAEKRAEQGQVTYRLEAKANGKDYTITVSENGHVKVEED